MNAFLRQMVALSALWALCELLLPEGGLSRMARLVVSLLIMTVLVASVIDALNAWTAAGVSAKDALGSVAGQSADWQSNEADYAQAYLRSQANQAEDLCVRMARGAGYAASAAVYLQPSGALERIDLGVERSFEDGVPPLLPAEGLRQKIAEAFGADVSQVRLSVGEGGSE